MDWVATQIQLKIHVVRRLNFSLHRAGLLKSFVFWSPWKGVQRLGAGENYWGSEHLSCREKLLGCLLGLEHSGVLIRDFCRLALLLPNLHSRRSTLPCALTLWALLVGLHHFGCGPGAPVRIALEHLIELYAHNAW